MNIQNESQFVNLIVGGGGPRSMANGMTAAQLAELAAYWRAQCDSLIKLLADRQALTPPPVMLANKESFEAGRVIGAKEGREACAKECVELIRESLRGGSKGGSDLLDALCKDVLARGAA